MQRPDRYHAIASDCVARFVEARNEVGRNSEYEARACCADEESTPIVDERWLSSAEPRVATAGRLPERWKIALAA